MNEMLVCSGLDEQQLRNQMGLFFSQVQCTTTWSSMLNSEVTLNPFGELSLFII